jgi:tetratricopeptide (TPR) repeat protein
MILSEPKPKLEEALALLNLGLNEEAIAAIEVQLLEDPCLKARITAVEIFNRLGHFDRAARCSDEILAERHKCTAEDLFLVSLAYNFSGRLQEAYDVERSIQPSTNEISLIRLYGLACKASRLGHYREALHHMLSCFRFQNVQSWDAHRKIFLDSEITDLWARIPDITLSLRESMRFCNLPFDAILEGNENLLPLRCVDHIDLRTMPARFRTLLQPAFNTCFDVSPVMQAAHPSLYAEYLAWQKSIILPRVGIFRDLAKRIRATVIDQQLAFARFQAERGRIACARNHIVCHLQNSPQANLNNLPEIPVLATLVEEFRAQYAESPEAFDYLISWKCKEEPETFLFDILPEMPERNRNSGYAKLALGCTHYRLGNIHLAIESWSACAELWPLDDAPVMNATMLLSGEERWDEASALIHRLPGQCMESLLWRNACTAIRERRSFSISNKIFTSPVIPTPTFGGLYSGADEEFLTETRNFTPICG